MGRFEIRDTFDEAMSLHLFPNYVKWIGRKLPQNSRHRPIHKVSKGGIVRCEVFGAEVDAKGSATVHQYTDHCRRNAFVESCDAFFLCQPPEGVESAFV